MRPTTMTAIALIALGTGSLPAPASAQDETAGAQAPVANVDVRRVTLATGGLAEVEGEMSEPGEAMRFAVERSLVSDVLRTLVVTGAAPVRSIDLEAAEPVGERSATGRLLAGDLADPSTILQSLIGERVDVRGGASQISGRLLAFNLVTIPGGEDEGAAPGVRIAVATEDGRVAYATFETLNALSIEGLAVRERVDGVVPALRESVDDGRRELTVRLDGEATAGFKFVVPTTVWRPSYRAIITAAGEVELQGWATLENTTGLDWDDITLRLAVGTPVAYSQNVYAPLRTIRPNAPFEVGRTAQTPLVESDMMVREEAEAANFGGRAARMQAMAAPAMPSMAMPMEDTAALVTGGPALAGTAATIFPVAGAIDLAAGRTLTVPFLDASDTAERVGYLSLSQEPMVMDALEISFDEAATVPGGLIAVFDEAGFVGDARFGGADGGERTILPFAASTDVTARQTQDEAVTLVRARFADGMLRIRREARREIALNLRAADAIEMVVDIPIIPGERISAEGDTPIATETIDMGLARARFSLQEGDSRVRLIGTRPIIDQFIVGNIPLPVIEEVLAVGGAVDAETEERLRALAAGVARVSEIDRQIATLEADVSDLRDAVEADRETLTAVNVATPEGARLRQRIVERTDEIDAALSQLRDLRRERLEEESAIRNP